MAKSKDPNGEPPRGSLKARALGAGGWSIFNVLVGFGFRLVSNLIMTRLLVPEAFGVMAMATVVLSALELFTDIGISRSIMREKDGDDPHFLRVAWVVRILRSAVIAIGLFIMALAVWILAPSLATEGSVYAAPELPGLLMLVALSPILDGLASTSRELTMRRMENRRFAMIVLSSRLMSLAAMAGFALIYPTVWALMVGMLTAKLISSTMTHVFLPGPRMAFEWDREIAARLWTFGRWILASSALTFFARSIDKLILAGLLSSTLFGLFVIAQIWIEAGRGIINRLSTTVGFPAMAEVIRTRPKDVPRLYRKFQSVIDLACFSAFVATELLGQHLINFLYTDDYSLAGRYLQLMAPSFLVIRFLTIGNLIMNTGDSRSSFIISSFRAAGALFGVPLGYSMMGTEGAILGAVLAPMFAVPYILLRVRSILTTRQVLFDTAWAVMTLILTAIVFWNVNT
ncbi:oligosaccharide flippase family protein [Octadecabacter sp. CECT 8868]|uniref:oligosaccharide flippase family protein n=1 Tax=Octadecabacter algicola TaxID=2909342 RepID=UPI001F210207|nr:oligosaccharide flippase family protein [Octadecabacter algicola]MCF2906668.1 oligosaccharide flippase family protein [Octadecabacter algicola]